MRTHTQHPHTGDLSEWAEDTAFVAMLLAGAIIVAAIALLFLVL